MSVSSVVGNGNVSMVGGILKRENTTTQEQAHDSVVPGCWCSTDVRTLVKFKIQWFYSTGADQKPYRKK
jgi:hypothetical protein